MIKSLDRIDILPEDLSVEKAEEIVINRNKKKFDYVLNPIIKKGLIDTDNNLLCLLSSDTTDTTIFGPATISSSILFFLIVGLFIEIGFKGVFRRNPSFRLIFFLHMDGLKVTGDNA